MANELTSYILIMRYGPPHQFGSTVDLIEQWKEGLARCRKAKDWTIPIDFEDEEGNVVASCQAENIMSIIRGAPMAEEKK